MAFHAARRRSARRPGPALTLAAATFTAVAGVLGATPALAQAGADWTTPGGGPDGQRYSSLEKITTKNVGALVKEFSVSTGALPSHQGQPLVIGGVMYVVSPFPHKLMAIDVAGAGTVLWTYQPPFDYAAHGVACCDHVNRGAAFGNGLIVFNTLDNNVVAVNAATGALAWSRNMGDPRTGQTMTGAPIIVRDRVIVGSAGAELGARGFTAGLNLATGAVVWKAYGTGPDADVKIGSGFKPFYDDAKGADLGATTWPGELWKQGGATSWGWFTYDPDLDLVYHGAANPGVWNPDMRKGDPANPDPRRSDNKWGSSIFARDPATGAAKWIYQVTPHDGWDYDATSENIVVDMKVDGEKRKTLVHFDKNGFAYTIDRRNGEVLVAKPFGAVTWAKNVDRKTGRPNVEDGMTPTESKIRKDICPSAFGAKDAEPASYSPRTKLFYVPAINLCSDVEAIRAVYIAGAPFMGADIDIKPGPEGGLGPHLGEIVAWDAAKGVKKWTLAEPLPVYGGTLATAGDLVFYGTLDKRFKALNAKTGEKLFETTLDCGIVGNPVTFLGADGKQRVAVYSGVGWLAGGLSGQGACATPGAVHVFKLP
jgi:PQQ-dependent dehydrogenase (methanol/ethanol family)